MKQIALLEYSFMFDPGDTSLTNGYQFENLLGQFFAAHNLETKILVPSGNSTKRIVYITDANAFDKLAKGEPIKNSKDPSKVLKDLQK